MIRRRKHLYLLFSIAALWGVAVIWAALHWNAVAPHLPGRYVVPGALLFGLLSASGLLWFNLKRGQSRAFALYNFFGTIFLLSGVGALWLFALPAIAFFVTLGIYFVFRFMAMAELRKPRSPQ
jgi:hypothetical protein